MGERGKEMGEMNGWGFWILPIFQITPKRIGSGTLINNAMSTSRRSVADTMFRHWFRHVKHTFENKWKTYLARRIHVKVCRVHDGPLMCPSLTIAVWFSSQFPGDEPANLKPISKKFYHY